VFSWALLAKSIQVFQTPRIIAVCASHEVNSQSKHSQIVFSSSVSVFCMRKRKKRFYFGATWHGACNAPRHLLLLLRPFRPFSSSLPSFSCATVEPSASRSNSSNNPQPPLEKRRKISSASPTCVRLPVYYRCMRSQRNPSTNCSTWCCSVRASICAADPSFPVGCKY